MKMQIKKIASLFLCICMALSMLTVASFAAETTYTFSNYTAGTQYASNEVHVLDENLTVVTTDCHFTTQLRIYSSSSNNGYAILKTAADKTFSGLKFNAGNKVDTLNVYGSNDDGKTWTLITGVSITTTSYKDYTADFGGNTYAQLKLDVAGTQQVRVASVTPSFETVVLEKYTATYVVPNGETAPAAEKASIVELPNVSVTGEYAKEYTFVGWVTEEVESPTTELKYLSAGDEVVLEKDTTFYAVYKYSEKSANPAKEFALKDITTISATDIVVITMKHSDGSVYALTNGGGASEAPAATLITVDNNAIVGEVADTLRWNINKSGDNYTIYPNGTTASWLYCTSSNNGVRVGTNANKVFTIDADSGYLKNTTTGRYLGVYNKQDWRCYTNTTGNTANQTLGCYVETAGDGMIDYYTTALEAAGSEVKAIKGANIVVGSDLTINFYVADEYANGTMTFAMNGKTTTVTADGTCFAFKGVAPDCMTDEITATLTAGGQTVGTLTTTVKDLATEYLSSENDKIVTFVANMLHYGAESQKYQNDNGDLANEGVTGNTTADPIKVDGIGLTESATTYFKSANVWFSNQNSIIVNLQNLPENAKLIVKKGDDVEFEGAASASYKTAGLKATELDTIYTFTVFDAEGNTLQSLTYSVNYYAFAMKDNAEIGSLVKALYNYGVSAKELA